MARGVIFSTGYTANGLGNPGTLEDWHKTLLLPDNYTVLGWRRAPGGLHLFVLVESAAIPDSATGLAVVMPVYHTDDTSTTLKKIEFEV